MQPSKRENIFIIGPSQSGKTSLLIQERRDDNLDDGREIIDVHGGQLIGHTLNSEMLIKICY